MTINLAKNHLTRRIFTITALIIATLSLSACIDTPEHRGYNSTLADISKLIVGTSSKADAQKILGSPSSTSTYGEETWYYIGVEFTKTASYATPQSRTQDVIGLRFDENGILSGMIRNAGEHNRHITFAEDKTQTKGNEITVMQQLLGNFGKFNAAK